MFRFTEPSHSDIQRFLAAATSRPLSYVDVGIASKSDPAGYQLDKAEVLLGIGEVVSEMKYTWKVIHEIVSKLEEALNGLQKDGFQVYQILPAGERGTSLEMGTSFVVVGRKELITAPPVR